jgi:biotin-(acetyl-CoA carboxylase) ligase
MYKLSILAERNTFFKDEVEDGKTYITFKNEGIEEPFKQSRQELIEGYAKLLAFQDLLKKVEKIYETDISYHIDERVEKLREYFEQNNQAIRVSTNTDDTEKSKGRSMFKKTTLYMKDDLIVDVDAIQPDMKAVEEHEVKLKRIFDGELF